MTRLRLLVLVTLLGSCASDIVAVSPPTTSSVPAVSTTTVEPATTAPATPSTSPTTSPTTSATTLPDPSSLPQSGSGEFLYASPGSFEVQGSPMIEFAVAVEEGSGVDADEVADFVVSTLGDQRGWVGRGAGFRIVTDGGLFTLVVATPDTVDELCRPLQTAGELSCASNGWIALNLIRWETATADWPADLVTYRRYLVNHEVGHYITGPNHASCPGEGQLAPIMMQQTKGLDGCLPNGWVDP